MSALISLHQRTLRERDDADESTRGYYKKGSFGNETHFQCGADATIAAVTPNGTVLELKRG